MFNEEANAFPKLKPTDRHTIKPGPAVEATATVLVGRQCLGSRIMLCNIMLLALLF